MPELNESTEVTTELVMDSVKEDAKDRESPQWHSWVALSTLVMALLTAIGALLAGITAHEALLERTEEIINIATCQGESTRVAVLKAKHDILFSLGETPDKAEVDQIQAYESEITALDAGARQTEEIIQSTVYPHFIFALAVTILAVGTSLCGMAIIIEKRLLWLIGLIFGIVGTAGVGTGLVMMMFP